MSLRSCKFNHVRREGNRLAHVLAKGAVISVDTNIWVESLSNNLDSVYIPIGSVSIKFPYK